MTAIEAGSDATSSPFLSRVESNKGVASSQSQTGGLGGEERPGWFRTMMLEPGT